MSWKVRRKIFELPILKQSKICMIWSKLAWNTILVTRLIYLVLFDIGCAYRAYPLIGAIIHAFSVNIDLVRDSRDELNEKL
ncbi:hypothetical protein Lal_00044662 [Lupinus albus]|nr:hypothetical protein Lal_00044662 [Lupinus albus]